MGAHRSSAWRTIWKSAWKDLVRSSRDPLVFLVWIGIPLGIGLLLNLAFAGGGGGVPRVHLLIVDEADSLFGRLLEGAGSGEEGQLFDVERVSAEEGHERIDAGDGSALLVLPENLGESILLGERAELQLFTNPSQRILPRIAEEVLTAFTDLVFYLQRVFGDRLREIAEGPGPDRFVFPDATVSELSVEMNRLVERLEGTFFPPLLDLEPAPETAEEPGRGGPTVMALMFPGFLIMALGFMAQGLSADAWRERDAGTLARAVSTPLGAAPLLLGKVVSGGILMLAVSLAAGALGTWAYGLDPRAMLLFGLFSPLAGTAFLVGFLLLNLYAGSQRAGNLLGSLVLFPLLMAGGSFFPLEALPAGLAAIGRCTPNGWVLEHLKRVAFDGASVGSLLVPAAGIALALALLFHLVLRRLPRFVGA